MMTLFSAMALMVGVFLLLGGAIPPPKAWVAGWLSTARSTDPTDSEAPDAAKPGHRRNWVTEQSLRLMHWSPESVRLASLASAGLVGLLWTLVMHNPIAGAILAILGWQLPPFAAELFSAGALTAKSHQVSTFIEVFADALETGQPVGQAVDAAARAITGPPLQDQAEMLIRRLHGNTDIHEALTTMGEDIQLPLWDLFVDLVHLNQTTVTRADIFRDLDWQLQEADRVQVEFRTLIMAYMAILGIFFAIMLGAGPIEAISSPSLWHFVTTKLTFIPLIVSVIAVVVFSGLRKYGRMRVSI